MANGNGASFSFWSISLGNVVSWAAVVIAAAVTWGVLSSQVEESVKDNVRQDAQIERLSGAVNAIAISSAETKGEINGNLAGIRSDLSNIRRSIEQLEARQ